MTLELTVCNPSDYRRAGVVTKDWSPIHAGSGIADNDFLLLDAEERPVPCQIDHINPENASHDVLTFYISEALPPGAEDYSRRPGPDRLLHAGEKPKDDRNRTSDDSLELDPCLKIKQDGDERFELINSKLLISFDLRPFSQWTDHTQNWWYSGSATSARVKNKDADPEHNLEMLDIWRLWEIHEPDKRCMQIAHIDVGLQPWHDSLQPHQEFPLFDRPYKLISKLSGPVRVGISVASEPFDYGYYDSSGQWCHLECRLFRVISLYANTDYATEELFVEGQPKDPACGTEIVDLYFSAHYFACMDMGFFPQIYQFPNIPDWFAVGWPFGYAGDRHPGYGFACDAHVDGSVIHPQPDYPIPDKAYKTFSWRMQPCQKATCLHLFMRGIRDGFDAQTGHDWYEVIYRPLRAKLLSEG